LHRYTQELAQVGVDVSEMQRMTQDVEEKLDRVMAAQGVTNRGVRLLCSVFDEVGTVRTAVDSP
jgi:hypothetical protein